MFLERHPLVLMPVSWQLPAPQDADIGSLEQAQALIAAQSPLLATACMVDVSSLVSDGKAVVC